jgi:hypothetical protein
MASLLRNRFVVASPKMGIGQRNLLFFTILFHYSYAARELMEVQT